MKFPDSSEFLKNGTLPALPTIKVDAALSVEGVPLCALTGKGLSSVTADNVIAKMMATRGPANPNLFDAVLVLPITFHVSK